MFSDGRLPRVATPVAGLLLAVASAAPLAAAGSELAVPVFSEKVSIEPVLTQPVLIASVSLESELDAADFSAAVVAESSAGGSDSAELLLSPRSCMPRNPALPCVERVRVRWHLPAATPVCLRQRGVEQPLFCDSGAEGERELQMPVRVSTRFELWQQAGLALLASAELVVISVPTTGQRRRYQHPWSLF